MRKGGNKQRSSIESTPRNENDNVSSEEELDITTKKDPSELRLRYPSDIRIKRRNSISQRIKYIPELNESTYIPEYNESTYIPEYNESTYIPEGGESASSPKPYRNVFRIIPILICVCVGWYLFTNSSSPMPDDPDDPDDILRRSIISVKKNFPSQNSKMWSTFIANIIEIKNHPFVPSVFLLLYDDSEETIRCLTLKVGIEAVKYLSGELRSPLILNGEDIKNNETISDYGELMEHYKQDIVKKHGMIVYNLQESSAIMAQMFHSLCDVENPFVSEVAYFFTLKVNFHKSERKNPTKIAENHLQMLWSGDIESDILKPLITRITNTVIIVETEKNIPCSL